MKAAFDCMKLEELRLSYSRRGGFQPPTETLRRLEVAAPWISRRAFSLIEIVLALGIISFALVGIMGLFPVAMKSAQESQRETRATQIAQQIFSDLKAMPGTNRLVAVTTNILTTQSSISLTTSGSISVSYDQNGLPLSVGTNHAERIFLASIQVTANSPMAGISQVQTTIETPALAASSNRSKYTFVTLMNQR